MGANTFLWKPSSDSDGNLVVLTPSQYNNKISKVVVKTPSGELFDSQYSGIHNENRGHWRFSQPGGSFPAGSQTLVFLDNGEVVTYDTPAGTGARNEGVSGQTLTGEAVGNILPEGVNVADITSGGGDFTFSAAQADYSSFNIPSLSRINVPYQDAVATAKKVGEFNVSQFSSLLDPAMEQAKNLLELEFDSMASFNRQARQLQQEGVIEENLFNQAQIAAANKFNAPQIAEANVFNQQQRLAAVDVALPEARAAIAEGISRNRALAEGRLPGTTEADRAMELAARSSGADITAQGGFGVGSIFGQSTADLLTAQEKLGLQQQGEAGLQSFIQLGAQLNFDQPIKQNPIIQDPLKATLSQQVPGTPAVPASQVAMQQQATMTELSTISPSTALQADIQQAQFQAQMDLDVDKFNIENIATEQLTKLNAELFNSQQIANMQNLATQTELAQSQFKEGIEAGRTASLLQAGGQLAGTLAGAWLQNSVTGGGIGGTIMNALGLGGGTASFTGSIAAPTTINGTAVLGSTTTASGAPAFALADGTTVAASELSGATATGATATAGEATLASTASTVAVPAAAIVAATAMGLSLKDFIQDVNNGNIKEEQVKQAIASTGSNPNAFVLDGLNKLFKTGFNTNDTRNAALLSNPMTAPLALADMVFGLDLDLSSGKSAEQQARDSIRSYYQDIDLVDNDYMIKLADGSSYNLGVDGGQKLVNYGINPTNGEKVRGTYDIDWSDPRAESTVANLTPVALMLTGAEYPKMIGHLWNAAISNNTTESATNANIRDFASQAGIDYKTGVSILGEYKANNMITNQEYMQMLNSWNNLYVS